MRTLMTAMSTLAMIFTVGCGSDNKKSTELTQSDRDKMVGVYEPNSVVRSTGVEYVIVTTDNQMYYLKKNSDSGKLEISLAAGNLKNRRFKFNGKKIEGDNKFEVSKIDSSSANLEKKLGKEAMAYVRMSELAHTLNTRLRASNLRLEIDWSQARVDDYPVSDIQLSLIQTMIDNFDLLKSYLIDQELEGVSFTNFTYTNLYERDHLIHFSASVEITPAELLEGLKEKTLL